MSTGTIFGGLSGYASKISADGGRASRCLVRSTYITRSPVFVHVSSGNRTPPFSRSVIHLTAVCRDESAEHRAKTYHSLVLHGKLRTAVRWITERERGGYCCRRKHAQRRGSVLWRCCTPNIRTHAPYLRKAWTHILKICRMVPVDITDDVVTAVAGRLSGGAGPGGTDSVSLQHWLLRF